MDTGVESLRSKRRTLRPPKPVVPEHSPLWPDHLMDLFFQPSRFFSTQLGSGLTPYVFFVTFCCGIAAAMDRIDSAMLRSDLGRPRSGWEHLAPFITESWLGYWGFVLILGSISSLFLWWVGGWWYQVRLRWSGEKSPDKKLARLVYIYSSFVWAGPIVLAGIIKTLTFANFQQAWSSEELFSLVLLIFPFWSLMTGYTGARFAFGVSPSKARAWFIVIPGLFYVVALGVISTFVYLASTLNSIAHG